jgi:hypothetical protein
MNLWINMKAVERFQLDVKSSEDEVEFSITSSEPDICLSSDRSIEKQIIKLLNKELFNSKPLDLDSTIEWSSDSKVGKIKI